MTDLPIMFSAPMILGLDREAAEQGTGKSMTSRLARKNGNVPTPWQHVQVGDRLWVRESLVYKLGMWWYAADDSRVALEPQHAAAGTAWAHHYSRDSAPSIHMPRALSRFTLIITGTKIRRLRDISDVECEQEGVRWKRDGIHDTYWVEGLKPETYTTYSYQDCFSNLWDHLHGSGAWKSNPEIVALRFTVHKQNIDSLNKQAA